VKKLATVLTVLAAICHWGMAQEQPAPAPNPGAGAGANIPGGLPGSPGGRPGQERMPRLEDQRTPFPDTMQRPIFLSGKVVMDDGTPPPDSVVIERVCNGMPRPEAYTDSKGRFSFQLGQNSAMMHDASVGSAADAGSPGGVFESERQQRGGIGTFGNSRGMSERDLMGCELRAALPGFRSEVVNLSGRRAFDNPDIGTIILRRLGNVEGFTISATSLQAPKEARKAYDKGRDALRKKKTADAQREFEKAVAAYPRYAAAWFELGRLQQEKKEAQQARDSYAKALEADPKFISPYLQLALMAAAENNWKDVADTTDRVIKLNPMDFPQAFFYNSVANFNLKNFDAAESSARQAEKLDGQHRFPKINHLLGILLAEKRDFTGAAEQMRSYLKFAPAAQDAATARSQLTEIERLADEVKKAGP